MRKVPTQKAHFSLQTVHSNHPASFRLSALDSPAEVRRDAFPIGYQMPPNNAARIIIFSVSSELLEHWHAGLLVVH